MSYFSQPKGDKKPVTGGDTEAKFDVPSSAKAMAEVVSIIGPGMFVTGNMVCAGSVQIFGRLVGDIHATRLLICEGAEVEGNVKVQELVIDGAFKGTIHGNSVKLQGSASVDGEIFNKSLTIEQNVLFEGMARRLDVPVDPPVDVRAKAKTPSLVPSEPAATAYQPAS